MFSHHHQNITAINSLYSECVIFPSALLQIANGELKLFMRNTFENKVYVATSSNGGETWDRCEPIDIPEYYCQLSVFNYQKDEK